MDALAGLDGDRLGLDAGPGLHDNVRVLDALVRVELNVLVLLARVRLIANLSSNVKMRKKWVRARVRMDRWEPSRFKKHISKKRARNVRAETLTR